MKSFNLAVVFWVVCEHIWGNANYAAGKDCSYEFKVWQPSTDELQRIRIVEIQFGNFTNYVDKQLMSYQLQCLRDVAEYRNWTIMYERSLNELKSAQMQKYSELQDIRLKLGVFEMNVEELKDKLENAFYQLSTGKRSTRKKHVRKDRMVPVHSSQADTPRHHLIDTLKSMVSDLKAEWILLKRDFISIKNDNQGIRKAHQEIRNTTTQFHTKDIQLRNMVTSLQSEESRLSNDVSNMIIKFGQLKSAQAQLRTNFLDQENGLNTLQASSADMRRGIMDLRTSFDQLRNGQRNTAINIENTNAERIASMPSIKPFFDQNLVPKDCTEVLQLGHTMVGVYRLKPNPKLPEDGYYCDIYGNSAYMVIQRRVDGLQDFDRGWLEYKFGFGNIYGEFWAGNDLIHTLTKDNDYGLRIDIVDWEGRQTFAEYDTFSISNEESRYMLRVGDYHGTAGDSLGYHNGMKFSTKDLDNDIHDRNCAADNKGGWWFAACFFSHLNGVYHVGLYSQPKFTFADGIVWYTLKDTDRYSLRKVEMKLKRRS